MERFAPRYDPRALTFLQMATSFVGFTVIASRSASSRCPRRDGLGRAPRDRRFAGALGYLVATWVQSRTTAARAALVFTLEAPFAALFGVLLADEILGLAGWVGCAVIMSAILVAEPACGDVAPARAATGSPGGDERGPPRALLGVPFGATSGRCASRCTALAQGGALFTTHGAGAEARRRRGRRRPLAGVWPFLLAGLLGPGARRSSSRSRSATPDRRARR